MLLQNLQKCILRIFYSKRQMETRDFRFERLEDLNLLGVIIFNLRGEIVDANDMFLELLGLDRSDLDSSFTHWSSVTPKDWYEIDQKAIRQLSRQGFFPSYEKELLHKDGRRIPVLVGATTMREGSNVATAFVVSLEKQKRHERLRKDLELLIEKSDQFVAITDENGAITFLNDKGRELLQPPSEESLRSLRLIELIHSFGDGSRDGGLYLPAESYEQEVTISSPFSGKLIPLRLQSFPLLNEQDHGQRYAFMGRDLRSELKSQERLQTALDVAQMAIWQYDFETEEFSRSAEHDRLYGFETNLPEWTNEILFSLIDERDVERVREFFKSLNKGEKPDFSIEYRIRLPDGSLRWLSSRGRVVYEEDQPVRLIGGILDITRLKETELELKETLGLRDRFFSIASHELKTPISSLQLQLDLLEHHVDEAKQLPEEQIDELKLSISESKKQYQRLTNLVNELLDVTRIANGKLKLEHEDCDLVSVWKDVIHSIAYEPGVGLHADVEESVVQADCERIRQVMLNLLTNAIKFGERREVSVQVFEAPGGFKFKVSDQGVGIPKDQQDAVFKRFEQSKGKTARGGLGLGLYICREIVDAHGGEIGLESEPGKGSCFEVFLPSMPPNQSK